MGAIPNSVLFDTKVNNEFFEKVSSFVIMGYPSKLNKLHKMHPEKVLSLFNIDFHKFFMKEKPKISISILLLMAKKKISFLRMPVLIKPLLCLQA